MFIFFLNSMFSFDFCRMNQPMSGSGSSLRSRQADNASPTPSDDSDSDISLGTHSPVPSSLSLQHSPGSTSGGGNDDRLMHDDLQRDREKDFRSFSLGGFSFDAHSPAMAGKWLYIFLEFRFFRGSNFSKDFRVWMNWLPNDMPNQSVIVFLFVTRCI